LIEAALAEHAQCRLDYLCPRLIATGITPLPGPASGRVLDGVQFCHEV
jgi:hypothetical protein